MPTNNYIHAIERMMRVLEAFGGRSELSLRELSLRSGIVKSSVFRILYTLEQLGYVSKDAQGVYSIAPRFSKLVGDPNVPADLASIARPLMAELVAKFKETVNLGVLDGDHVLYIHVIESPHPFRLVAHAGIESPIHSTALGKCLVAYMEPNEVVRLLKSAFRKITRRTICDEDAFLKELARVRKRGYAVDDSEDSVGTRCLGAPIFDTHERVIAALSVSGPASRLHAGRDAEVSSALIKTSQQISKLIRYHAGVGMSTASGG